MPDQPTTFPASGLVAGVELRVPDADVDTTILTPSALALVARLERRFRETRQRLLARRRARQQRIDAGERPDFPEETADVRAGDWKVGPLPSDLLDRRVEITGPVDRKMIINALNSGANVFMADFEDSTSPTWRNVIDGQVNLRDAVRRTIRHVHPVTGKVYELGDETATLVVRPRGWHLDEAHVHVDGRPVSASIFDFALYFFHNAHELIARGTGPYFYLPKLENRHEARLWNAVFEEAQIELKIPVGTIKATVLIETILAAFEMDEILYELREHAAGLNCGRWDYIFSFIKTFRNDPAFVLPDRGVVTMDQPFLRSYSRHLIRVCHRRGAHAMGGMAAQIPVKSDEARNRAAMEKVALDKRREARDGHDGTWVAHPGLVALAREELDAVLRGPNQLDARPDGAEISAQDLLAVPEGPITEATLRQNLNVGVRYVEAWLGGTGCVPLFDLMEDAATAEISRTQVWQWIRHAAQLDDGRPVTQELVREALAEECEAIRLELAEAGRDHGRLELAVRLFQDMLTADEPADFLTLIAYDHIRSART